MPPGQRPAKPVSRARPGGEEEFVPAPRSARGPQEASRPAREAPPKQPAPQREPHGPESRAQSQAESKLSSTESRLLAFEARWWRASGAKTQAISDELELTPERYYQHLARLIDHPEAAAEQPAVVRRLRAARDQRRAER
ncbi:DUF3263 domain-containing protein [Glycomyces tritici]|uniref:DUF3263 domain-containing protein n=1 Tax=Glycomyces tritici TaxID=2665176 RepID=A0ABT7YPV3_9ACTN|nr:DUF3263 domain-containing protein [Glycomyces tritici]MDN3240439.1 DUF3263 domain-containing protein [Glycomyces tritici]